MIASRSAETQSQPCHLLGVRGPTWQDLRVQVERFLQGLRGPAVQPLPTLVRRAAETWRRTPGAALRLAVVAANLDELRARLETAKAFLAEPGAAPRPGLHVGRRPAGKLAFLYPGHGAEHLGMLGSIFPFCRELGEALADAAQITAGRLAAPLTSLVGPEDRAPGAEREDRARQLGETSACQPALAVVEAGLTDWLAGLGVRPHLVAGHSFGELAALYAAGCNSRADFFELATRRGRLYQDLEEAQEARGGMLAVATERARLEQLEPAAFGVHLANHNGPRQVLVSGPVESISDFRAHLRRAGIAAVPLKVNAAFHSPAMRPAREPEAAIYRDLLTHPPQVPVVACLDGAQHPDSPAEIGARVAEVGARPVEFVAQVRTLWDEGVRFFLEVGPGSTLARLVPDVLGALDARVGALDGGPLGYRGTLETLAALVAWGAPVDLVRLAGREPEVGAARPGVVEAVLEHQRTTRELLAVHERVMNRLLGVAPGSPAEAALPTSTELPPPPELPVRAESVRAPAPGTGPDAEGLGEGLAARLRALVHARTGYPESSIGLDVDLERDLCVDSLKRVEILAGLDEVLDPASWARVRPHLDQVVQRRTLRAILAHLGELVGAEEEGAPGAVDGVPTGPRASIPPPLYRGVMVAEDRPLIEAESALAPVQGAVLVTGEADGLGGALVRALSERGCAAALVSTAELASSTAVAEAAARVRHEHGPITGIVHTAGWRDDDLGEAEARGLDRWRAQTQRGVKALYQLVSDVREDLQGGLDAGFLLVVTGLGGAYGRRAPAAWGSLVNAAALGMACTLPMEWTGCWARVVDLDSRKPDAALAKLLVAEVQHPGGEVEVGYLDGKRVAYHPAVAPRVLAAEPQDLSRFEVVFFAGGARGIGFDVARTFARPGATLVFAGRTRLEGTASPTPQAQEVRENLQALRSAGATVEYHCVDLRDEAGVGALLADVYDRHGRIDAALLLAGIAARATIETKSLASFGEVFDAKADPAFLLARYLRPESLRLLVLFASVSGRFGCRSQADYAAANELLVRIGWRLADLWPGTRVLSVAWGPWSERGMAADEVTLQAFRAVGVEVIQPEEGRRFLEEELRHGAGEQCEVLAGGGPWSLPRNRGEERRHA